METIIECKLLTKYYDDVLGIEDANLKVGKGKIVGLLGPNGSGKTTLIKLINGLLVPTKGEILINGMKPGKETKKIVSYLPERNQLSTWMKVKELIEFYHDFYEDFNEKKAVSMLKEFDIDLNLKFGKLSKGTREKVQLALIMSREAELYCLDEPIGGVDPLSREYIIKIILGSYNKNATLLISTHLITDIENILDEIILVKDGHIIEHRNVKEVQLNENASIDQYFRRRYSDD